MDSGPMKHREPDKEILEHERKRKIEVACYDLRIKLEDDELVHSLCLQFLTCPVNSVIGGLG
jgi:cwf21 domain